jgi:hypothetical protein
MSKHHIFDLSGKGSKITHEAKERLLQSRDDVHSRRIPR